MSRLSKQTRTLLSGLSLVLLLALFGGSYWWRDGASGGAGPTVSEVTGAPAGKQEPAWSRSVPGSIPVNAFQPDFSAGNPPPSAGQESGARDAAAGEEKLAELRAELGGVQFSEEEEKALKLYASTPGGLDFIRENLKRQQNGVWVPSEEFKQEIDRQHEDLEKNSRGEVKSLAVDASGTELPSDPYVALRAQTEQEGEAAPMKEHSSEPYFSQVGRLE